MTCPIGSHRQYDDRVYGFHCHKCADEIIADDQKDELEKLRKSVNKLRKKLLHNGISDTEGSSSEEEDNNSEEENSD